MRSGLLGKQSNQPTANDVSKGILVLDDLRVYSECIFWRQVDPHNGGRCTLFKRDAAGRVERIVPAEYDVKSSVQGYGGGAYCVHDDSLYFVNHCDHRIYRRGKAGDISPISPESSRVYGDLIYDSRFDRVICISELPAKDHLAKPVTQIVAICCASGELEILSEGSDFYASPRIGKCGNYIAWTSWEFPHMPWDQSKLEIGRFSDEGKISEIIVSIENDNASVIEPKWGDDGALYYLSDQTGWWNLYRYTISDGEIKSVLPCSREFGFPPYILGLSTYAIESGPDEVIYAVAYSKGKPELIKAAVGSSIFLKLANDFCDFKYIQIAERRLYFIGFKTDSYPEIIEFCLDEGRAHVLYQPSAIPSYPISRPQYKEHAIQSGSVVHSIIYLPTEATFPVPLIVNVHGGPTGIALGVFSPQIQFWTSRGFAYAEINHRGSTGFGRRYRDSLNGNWGIAEIEDAELMVKNLVDEGLFDPSRIVIRGNSAGGFSALSAAARGTSFCGATSYWGVTDLVQLRNSTHKFESYYLDSLIGPFDSSEDLFVSRSPINLVDNIRIPVFFIQGLKDTVVPPDQASQMVNGLARRGKPVISLEFPDEGHGLRQPNNIKLALLAELYFYSRIFDVEHDVFEQATREEIEHIERLFDHLVQ